MMMMLGLHIEQHIKIVNLRKIIVNIKLIHRPISWITLRKYQTCETVHSLIISMHNRDEY